MADTSKQKKRPVRKKKPAHEEKKNGLNMFRRRRKDEQPAKAQREDTVAGNGQVLQNKSALLGKIVAWAFVAFVGVGAVLAFTNSATPTTTAEQVVQVGQTPEEQQAADYAKNYVGAWLRATQDDDSEIAQYMQVERGDITATEATEYRELAVASSDTNDEGISTVIVSAEVLNTVEGEDTEGDEEDQSQEVWQSAWYHVNIYHEDTAFVPLGWPAPTPAPEIAIAPRLAYSYDASEEVTATITDFFESYALGEGEVTRLTHPDSQIQPLGADHYSYVEISEVTTEEDHRKNVPQDETTTQAFVQLRLGKDADSARAATYTLTLETRGGRWEVRAFDPAPVINNDQISAEVDETATEKESTE